MSSLFPETRDNSSVCNPLKRRSFIKGVTAFGAIGAFAPLPSFATDSQMQIGVGAHLWRATTKEINKTIAAAKAANLKILRWDAPWKAVETVKGQLRVPAIWDYIVDTSLTAGIDTLLILDYGNRFYENADKPILPESVSAFARYAEFIALHFAGRVKYFEIWNEWNGRVGDTTPGNSRDYARLILETYPKLKSAAKDSIVLAGGLSSNAYNSLIGYGDESTHFEEILSTRALDVVDAISIHPYVVYRTGYFQTYAGFETLLSSVVSRIRRETSLASKPLIITELGWTTASGSPLGVSEEEQAAAILRAKDFAASLGIHAFLVYEIRDGRSDSADPEANFGILKQNWEPKRAYVALAHEQQAK